MNKILTKLFSNGTLVQEVITSLTYKRKFTMLKINKKKMKELSNSVKAMPIEQTPAVAGGWAPTQDGTGNMTCVVETCKKK